MTLRAPDAPAGALGPNERVARIGFHAAYFLPGLSLPWLWLGGFFVNWKRERGEGRFWGWMVLGLAALDTLAAVFLVAMSAGILPQPPAPRRAPQGARIGVELAADAEGGARIERVSDDSPAARADLASGDLVVAIDGEPVRNASDFVEQMSSKASGIERRLTIERSGERIERAVHPVDARELAPESRGLFEPLPPGESDPDAIGVSPASLVPAALAFLALWWRARRRASGAVLVLSWIALLLAAGALAGSIAMYASAVLAGGATRGGLLLAMAAGTLVPLVLAWIALKSMEARGILPPRATPRLGLIASTYGLGLVYLAALVPRVGALAAGIGALLAANGAELPMLDPMQLFDALGLDARGTLALVFVVAALAPLGEELGFRAILLPWLARGLRPVAAVAGSALVFGLAHPHYGAIVLVPIGYGLVLGWARLRTGGVTASVLLHVTINVVASAPLWWPLVAG